MRKKIYYMSFDSIFDADLEDDKIRDIYLKHSKILEDSRWLHRPGKFKGSYDDWKKYLESITSEDLMREWPVWGSIKIAISQDLFLYLAEIELSRESNPYHFSLINVVEEYT